MCAFVYVYPRAKLDEIATFIVNNGGDVYSRQIVQSRLDELNMTRKKASTEAYQAFLPHNIAREERFWSQGPPLGVNGVLRRMLLDLDECGISLDQCNRKSGFAHKSVRIRDAGHYTRGKKLTVIAAVERGDPTLPPHMDGSVENPRRYWKITEEAGTTQAMFADFVDEVCTHLETSGLQNDNDRIFMLDN